MEDEKIVELLYEHNEKGLIETKNKYETLLNSLSYKILRNHADSRECVNDTYLKIWKTIPPYKPTFFKSFICKIIRQISIDKYRYNHRKNRCALSDLDYDIKDNKDKISEKLLINTINDFIENLTTENQVLFIRKYFLFEETKELSKRFNMSETNINVKLFRIKNKLKKHLESEGYIIEKI